jgi:hypothetical protein
MLIARDGAVREARFVIRRAAYQTVILPPADTLLASTVGLLEEFLRAGGSVIALSSLPYMIEGEASKNLQALLGTRMCTGRIPLWTRGKILEGLLPRRVSIT